MQQNSSTPQQSGEGHRCIPLGFPAARSRESVLVQAHEEPKHQPEAKQAGLHQQLRIVIMRFIDEQVRIEAAVTRVDRGESPQAPPQQRPVGKHSEAILRDIPTNARGQISESAQHLSLAYKNQESQNRDTHGHRSERYAKATLLFESQRGEQNDLKNESKHS